MANKRQKKAKPNDRLNYGDVSRELKAGGPARLYLLYGRRTICARRSWAR